MPQGTQSDVVFGFAELAQILRRPAHALRAAHSIDLLPLRSEMRGGARCFNGADARLLGAILAAGEDVA